MLISVSVRSRITMMMGWAAGRHEEVSHHTLLVVRGWQMGSHVRAPCFECNQLFSEMQKLVISSGERDGRKIRFSNWCKSILLYWSLSNHPELLIKGCRFQEAFMAIRYTYAHTHVCTLCKFFGQEKVSKPLNRNLMKKKWHW